MVHCFAARRPIAAVLLLFFAGLYTFSRGAFIATRPGRDSQTTRFFPARQGVATKDVSERRESAQSAEHRSEFGTIFRSGCTAFVGIGALALRNRAAHGSRLWSRLPRRFDFKKIIFAPSDDWQVSWNGKAATLLRLVSSWLIFRHGMEHTVDGGWPGSNEVAVQGMADFVIKPYFWWVPFFSPTDLVIIRDYCESVGAFFLFFGFFTRPVAGILGSVMLAAVYYHVSADGFDAFSFEEPLIFVAIFGFFFANGAGPISIDAQIKGFFGADGED